MKHLFLISCLGLCSCASQDMFQSQGVKNGCVIDASVKQAALKAKAKCDKQNLWAKVLVVRFYKDEVLVGHAYCVFEDVDGAMWAYDWAGSRKLKGNSKDPLYISAQLRDGVQKAFFSDNP